MIRLLMLDFDARLISAVSRGLSEGGVDVVGVSSVEQALAQAGTGTFDIALLDGDMLGPRQLGAFSSLPVVLTTSLVEAAADERAVHARTLRKPFTNAELMSVLRDMFGSLGRKSQSIVDVLRRAHTEGRDLALRVGKAEIFVAGGEIVHAELDGLSGEAALAEALANRDPPLSTIPERRVARTIHKPFQRLLLDALHFIEERERKPPSSRAPSRAQDESMRGRPSHGK